jgi:hypothetical protein
MDLTTPVDHADAYTWAAVALAHLAIGLVLTGALAAVLSRLLPGAPGMGRGALGLVIALYLLGWECAVQGLGAGIADALLDTAMIATGGALGLLAWRRKGKALAAVIFAAGLALAHGIRSRRK